MPLPPHIKTDSLLVFAVSLLCFLPAFGLVAGAHSTTNAPLCVMTFNLRYADTTPPNAWPGRRPIMVEMLNQTAPDLIGTQEGLQGQLQDLAADLPDYNWAGVGRDDGRAGGEFMAVFYRKSRLEALATNHFWLSDTPEIPGSATWGNRNRRMVTWLKFRDRDTGGEFFVFNTHFDHQVQSARENSARLVRQRVALFPTNLPVLLLGDFNAPAETSRPWQILTAGDFFTDAWKTAATWSNDGIGTFNDFQPGLRSGPRIDWILTRGGVAVERVETVTFSRNGQFPSDHFPVLARLKLRVHATQP